MMTIILQKNYVCSSLMEKNADQVISEARSYRGKKAKLLLLHQQGK